MRIIKISDPSAKTIKRVYVAGPMSGLPNFNKDAFAAAAHQLNQLGFTAVNPFRDDDVNGDELAKGKTYESILAQSLSLLLTCDAIYLLDGWEKSHGAQIEYHLAQHQGIHQLIP